MSTQFQPPFSIQSTLETATAYVLPLQAADFEALYTVAADPAIWAQHPNRNRWQRPVFATFFEGALQSRGAFRLVDKATGATLGSTRLYGYNPADNSILIGYTFYGTATWGTGLNQAVKTCLLDYLFAFVDTVRFHIGADNIRSQVAIQRLGANIVGEQQVAYYGEPALLNKVFEVTKAAWTARQNQPALPADDEVLA